MLSLTLIFRNFHLAARGADRWRQVLNQLRSLRVRLTHRWNKPDRTVVPRETTKVSREGLVSALLAATEKAARRDPISRRRRGSSAGPWYWGQLLPAAIVSGIGQNALLPEQAEVILVPEEDYPPALTRKNLEEKLPGREPVRGGRDSGLENRSGSVAEPKVRIHLPPAGSQVRTRPHGFGNLPPASPSASAWPARRGRRPQHVGTLLAREPGDLTSGQSGRALVRIGKVMSRSR